MNSENKREQQNKRKQTYISVSVSVYYVAVRTIVLSRHGSNIARHVIIHDIIHGLLYVSSTPSCGFFGVSPGTSLCRNRAKPSYHVETGSIGGDVIEIYTPY